MPLTLAPANGTPYLGGNVPGHQYVTADGMQGILKHNLAGALAPAATDDAAHGYAVGSMWVTTGGYSYICVDATTNAAVWAFVGGAILSYAASVLSVIGSLGVTGDVSVTKTTTQLTAKYDAGNYFTATVSSTGVVTLDAVGTGASFAFSDKITLPAGTVALPSLAPTGDPDTGLAFPELNKVSQCIGGAEAFSVQLLATNMYSMICPQIETVYGSSSTMGRTMIVAEAPNWTTSARLELHASNGNYNKCGFTLDAGAELADNRTLMKSVIRGITAYGSAVTNKHGGAVVFVGGAAANGAGKTGIGGGAYVCGGAKSPAGTDGDVYLNHDGTSAKGNTLCYGQMTVGNGTFDAQFCVVATTEQMRLKYSSTKYVSFVVDSTGDMTITPVGGNIRIAADVDVPLDKAFYVGDPGVDGTWRFIRDGNNLVIQRRESSVYVTKQTVSA